MAAHRFFIRLPEIQFAIQFANHQRGAQTAPPFHYRHI